MLGREFVATANLLGLTPRKRTMNNDKPLSNCYDFKIEEVRTFSLLVKGIRSKWRSRTIDLYQHPTEPNTVVSVGYPDSGGHIIDVQKKDEWALTLIDGQMVYE